MNNQIIDINRTDIPSTTVFCFKNSLKPFILTQNETGQFIFVNLTENECFEWENVPYYDLEFYTREDDEDFYGVKIITTLQLNGLDT